MNRPHFTNPQNHTPLTSLNDAIHRGHRRAHVHVRAGGANPNLHDARHTPIPAQVDKPAAHTPVVHTPRVAVGEADKSPEAAA